MAFTRNRPSWRKPAALAPARRRDRRDRAQHHLIDQAQYTELVTVVILSAFVPTLIAQQFFRPPDTDAR